MNCCKIKISSKKIKISSKTSKFHSKKSKFRQKSKVRQKLKKKSWVRQMKKIFGMIGGLGPGLGAGPPGGSLGVGGLGCKKIIKIWSILLTETRFLIIFD